MGDHSRNEAAMMMTFERIKQANELADNILFDEQLRAVSEAMYEPEPAVEKRGIYFVGTMVLNALLWVPIAIIGFELLRP